MSGKTSDDTPAPPSTDDADGTTLESATLADARALSPALVDLFVANHRAFLAFLARRVGDRAIAEDLLQEAFVKGMKSLDANQAIHGNESIVAWFYQSLRNAAVDHHRRHHTASQALASFARETPDQVEPDAAFRAAVCQCVLALAETLKPEFATALRRIEVDGLAVKDYAAEAGISASHAGVRIFRARQALGQQLARSCGTCAEHGCFECSCDPRRGACDPSPTNQNP